MAPRPRQCRYGRHRDIIAENQWRSPGSPAPAVEDNVIGGCLEGEINVGFYVIRRQLETDGNTPRDLPHPIGKALKVSRGGHVDEGRRRNGGGFLGQIPHLGDLAGHLGRRQVAAGPGLGALTAFEVEGLDAGQEFFAVAEFSRRQFV